ncbi:MAG: tetratricopeptide repeat protein [Thermoanaerobaculum sp.]
MRGIAEHFAAGQVPFILKQHAQGPGTVVRVVHASVTRTFSLAEGKVVGFSSSHPEEQLKPGGAFSDTALIPVLALARLVPASGEYAFLGAPAPSSVALALPVTWLILEALRRTQDVSPVLAYLDTQRPFTRAGSDLPGTLELAPVEAFVWDRLQSPLALHDLERLLPEQRQAISRAFAGLACAGLLVPADTPPKPEKPCFPPASPKLRERLARIAREGGLPTVETEREPSEQEMEQSQRDKEQALALLAQGGDERQAVRLLSRAVSVLPDPHSLVRLAEVEVANPLWRQRALAHLKQALEMEPTFTPAWLALANYWALRGDIQKQRRCLESILKYDPQNRDVREALRHLNQR